MKDVRCDGHIAFDIEGFWDDVLTAFAAYDNERSSR